MRLHLDAGERQRNLSMDRANRRPVGEGDFVYRGNGPFPIFTGGVGSRLRDIENRLYLDMEAANGGLALGYDASLLRQSVERSIGMPALPSFLESELRLRVAAKIVALFQRELGLSGRVAFDVGGAQGIELALKVAHAATNRDAVAVFEEAYHGRSVYTAQLSASRRYRDAAPHIGAEVIRLPCPEAEDGCGTAAAIARLKRILEDDGCGISGPGPFPVGAFVFEPVLNVGGMYEPDPAYLRACADSFRAQGAIVIADEIFTGFHRTGAFLGVQRSGVVPDIVVLSKALTNGMAPLACVWARDDLLSPERFPPGTHSVTFANTPLCLAIAETVLDRFDAWPGVEAAVGDIGRGLTRLAENIAPHRLVESAAVIGAICRVRLNRPWAFDVREAALHGSKTGLLLASTGASPHILNIHPSLTVSMDEIAEGGCMLLDALQIVQNARAAL